MSDLVEKMKEDGKLTTVEQELERGEAQSPPNSQPTAFVSPVLEGYSTSLPAPGIYFGVPDEIYHAWPALSCSGIRKLAASPTLYWATTPWLNVEREEPEEKAWAAIGKAYHARILEGPAAFEERFAIALDKTEYGDELISGNDELQAAIARAGGVPVSRIDTGETKPGRNGVEVPITRAAKKEDWTAQLLELVPDAPIWEQMCKRHEEANAGKTMLSFEVVKRIEMAAKMIELHPELPKFLRAGYPEVSLFWYCPKTGVPMKARADYLKVAAVGDLKSFENMLELAPENAIRKAIANKRYPLQPSVYIEGIQEVRAVVRDNPKGSVWTYRSFVKAEGMEAVSEPAPATGDELAFALKWAAQTSEPEWLWIFQQKGVAPITRGIMYPKGGTTRLLFDEIVSRAKKRFRQCAETFGTDMWVDVAPIDDTFADEDIPDYGKDI